jgi:hypothetical protein
VTVEIVSAICLFRCFSATKQPILPRTQIYCPWSLITRDSDEEETELGIRRLRRFSQIQDQVLVLERLHPEIQQKTFAEARGFQYYDHRAVADKIGSIERIRVWPLYKTGNSYSLMYEIPSRLNSISRASWLANNKSASICVICGSSSLIEILNSYGNFLIIMVIHIVFCIYYHIASARG